MKERYINPKLAKELILLTYDLLAENRVKSVFGWDFNLTKNTKCDGTGFTVTGNGFARSRMTDVTWCKTKATNSVFDCKNRVELSKDGKVREYGKATIEKMIAVLKKA